MKYLKAKAKSRRKIGAADLHCNDKLVFRSQEFMEENEGN